MLETTFVARDFAMERLVALLERQVRTEGDLRILSIEGPGGVGKSTLVRRALKQVAPEQKGYLQLTVDRNFKRQSTAQTLHGIVRELVTSATGGSLSEKAPGHYFPETNDAIRTMEALQSEVLAELESKKINRSDIVRLNETVKGIIGLVEAASEVVPVIGEYVSPDGLKGGAAKIDANAETIAALATESLGFMDRLGISSRTARRNLAKTSPSQLLSQALIADLRPLLIGKHENNMVPGHGKMRGVERLLVVLEDYESLAPLVDQFLLSAFLKQLKTAGIDTTLLIIGRDRLSATNPTWKKDFNLDDPIVVKVFTQSEVADFLISKGISDKDTHLRAWRDSFGLPFLLETWIREEEAGGRSALSVKEFYDRIKIWMTPQQQEWMKIATFLSRIDGRILGRIIDDKKEAEAALEWFKCEASIRDPNASVFTMIPMVREMVASYLSLEGMDVDGYRGYLRTKLGEMQGVVLG